MSVHKRESRKTRHQTQHKAWMTLDGGFAKRTCTVLNISATGACIHAKEVSASGGKIVIAFSNDVRKATRCRLVWQKGPIMGVEFLGAA